MENGGARINGHRPRKRKTHARTQEALYRRLQRLRRESEIEGVNMEQNQASETGEARPAVRCKTLGRLGPAAMQLWSAMVMLSVAFNQESIAYTICVVLLSGCQCVLAVMLIEHGTERGGWLHRMVSRLFCGHVWQPAHHMIYGAHSQWDCVTHPPRAWQCAKCGKRVVRRDEPVSFVG